MPLLGGHCQQGVAVIPNAQSIIMGLQLLVYVLFLFEYYRSFGVEKYGTKTNAQKQDEVTFL